MSGELVLVVEDDTLQNKKICNIVEKAGYKAIPAYDGLEAFVQLKKYRRGLGFLSNRISCILLDWQMPKMRGEEFIRILRRQEHWKTYSIYIPIVIITAYDDIEKRQLAASSFVGMAADYITKPIEPERLIDTLHRIIKDKDNETLIEMNRERGFQKNTNELKEEILEAKTHLTNIKKAYYQGQINEDALEYLEKKKIEAEIEFEEAKKIGKLDKKTLKNLEDQKEFAVKEYYKMLNQLPKKEEPN